jgi:hypothetical protein
MSLSCVSASGLSVGVVAIVASACGNATEPRLPASNYDLVSYEGQRLPVETRVIIAISIEPGGAGYSCSDRLTAMNLRFVTSASFTQTESRLLVCDDGRPDAPSSAVMTGTYELRGRTLVLNLDLGGGFSQRSAAQFSDVGLTIYHREILQDGAPRTVTDAPLEFVATQ